MVDETPALILQSEAAGSAAAEFPKPKTNRPNLNKLYALPAPLRTFPLPTLVPHNPISLFHVLYVWLSQTISPPSSHFDTPYHGWWSPETRSVHVTDGRSIRGLWEQGFYGKGSLSRSEPSWMSGQKARKENKGKATSEDVTKQRRAVRQQTKWERARKEREAIEQRLLEEAKADLAIETAGSGDSTSTEEEVLSESDTSVTVSDGNEGSIDGNFSGWLSPVGPLELLTLPNSRLDLAKSNRRLREEIGTVSDLSPDSFIPPPSLSQSLKLPHSHLGSSLKDIIPLEENEQRIQAMHYRQENVPGDVSLETKTDGNSTVDGIELSGHVQNPKPPMNDHSSIIDAAVSESAPSNSTAHIKSFTSNGSALSSGSPSTPKMKRQKSVRFSPTVEKNTFIHTEPPSPEHATLITTTIEDESEPAEIVEQEHFQLTLEEAFFLSYSLGVLNIFDPATRSPIPNKDLFLLFRKSSYFSPLANPSLAPDDPFMLNYVVYHHFRSLGWVVRGGVKFAVDFMLYNRGPVFSHAEFAVVVLPSYSDPYWSSDSFLQNYVNGKEKRTWAWFHCINRVITQVRKTLLLVYVDVPKPMDDGALADIGVDGVLGRYKVREVVMQRWLSNRQRD